MLNRNKKHYVFWLWLLSGLFAMRVMAQLVQYGFQTDWLPAFEQWQGSNLPYPVLLVIQVAILLVLFLQNTAIVSGRQRASGSTGKLLLITGAIYFVTMATRLLLGLGVYADYTWYARWLPAFFHLVLASYVLLLGLYHVRFAREVPGAGLA